MQEISGNRNLAGVGYMLFSMGSFSVMDSVAKALVVADYSVMQILAIRGWIIIAALTLMLPRLGGLGALKTTQPYRHLIRVVVGFGAPYFFFSSLRVLGLADAVVIALGGATFLMTALSVPLFNEKVGRHRWGAVVIGFIGVLIAVQPSRGVFQIEALYGVAAGATYAMLVLATRWLGPGEGTFKPVFYYNLGLAFFASFALPVVYETMPGGDLATLITMGVLAVGGQFGMTRALHIAPVSLLAPFEYSALIWAAALGYLFWGEVPANNVLLGAAIIVSCGLYLVHREALAARAQKREQAALVIADPPILATPATADE